MNKWLIVVVTLICLLSLSAGTVWAAEEKLPPTINVTGSGKVSVAPDITLLNFEVITTDPSPIIAQNENSKKMTEVYANLTAKGIAKEDIETVAFNISPVWEYIEVKKSTELTGYRVTNSIMVKIRKVDAVGGVISAVTAAGVNSIQGLTFDLNQKAPYRLEALKAAAKDARQQAETVASALGLGLGAVRSVNVDSYSYDNPRMNTVVYSAKAYDGGVDAPISANNVDITARVYVTYELVQQ